MNFDVITIGSSVLDIFITNAGFKIISDNTFPNTKGIAVPLDQKINDAKIVFRTGGGALNTAITFSNFNLKTGIISSIAKDIPGNLILNELKKHRNINLSFLTFNEVKTSVSAILLASSSDRTIIKDDNFLTRVKIKDLSKIKTKNILISSLGGNINNWKEIIRYKKNNPKTLVFCNPSNSDFDILKSNLEFFKYLDVLSVNLEEAIKLSNVSDTKDSNLLNYLAKLTSGICIITKGKDGLILSDHKYIYEANSYEIPNIVSSNGAGDALISGFVLGYTKTNDIEYSIRLGLANSGNVLTDVGANANLLNQNELNKPFWKTNFNKLPIKKTKIC